MSLPQIPREAAWGSLLAAGLAYELYELRRGEDGVPLSKVIRRVFRTHTPAGRLLFVRLVEGGTGWLIQHILDEQTTTTRERR